MPLRSISALTVLAVAVLLSLAASSATAADPFHESLLAKGKALYAAGDYESATHSLRLACFGLLEDPPVLANCLAHLGLAQIAISDMNGFQETFLRVAEVQRRHGAFCAADLSEELRTSFENQLRATIPPEILSSTPWTGEDSPCMVPLSQTTGLPTTEVGSPLVTAPQTEVPGDVLPEPTSEEGATVTDSPPEPVPTPARDQSSPDQSNRSEQPATRVEEINWQKSGDNALRVTVSLNGAFSRERVRHERLDDPPRHLFRLIGIEQEFKPYTLRTETPQVRTVRIGFHDERDPPELHVVFDLGGEGTRVTSFGFEGNTLVVQVEGQPSTSQPDPQAQPGSTGANDPAPDPTPYIPSLEENLLSARQLYEAAEYQQAMEQAAQLAETHRSSNDAQLLAAEVAYRLKRWSQAVLYFDRAGEIPSNRPSLSFYKAVALYETGDLEGAKQALESCNGQIQRTPYVDSYIERIQNESN